MKTLILLVFTFFAPLALASECSQWANDAYQFTMQNQAGSLAINYAKIRYLATELKCNEISRSDFCKAASDAAHVVSGMSLATAPVIDLYNKQCLSNDPPPPLQKLGNARRSNRTCAIEFNFGTGTLDVSVSGYLNGDFEERHYGALGATLDELVSTRNKMAASGYCDIPEQKDLPDCEVEKSNDEYTVSILKLHYYKDFKTESEAKTNVQYLIDNSLCR